MAYFRCTTGGSGKGNTLVVTCADDLAGATITCTNGTKTYRKTCPSTAPYEVTFYGLMAGTWTVSATVSGNTYTTTVVVADIEALLGGFNWRTWVDTASQLDSSDYDSLDEVLADELAVRELCLEHACVDYLADIATANEDVETIINNDLFAKWVNNSDYSLDVLGANVVIKALMDESDKYGYGEWCLMPQVPKMTANNAPYGVVSSTSTYSNNPAWKMFDGDDSTSGYCSGSALTSAFVQYEFVSPVEVSAIGYKVEFSVDNECVVSYSDDGNTFTPCDWVFTIRATSSGMEETSKRYGKHRYWRLTLSSSTANYHSIYTLQFYAYAPKGNVPIMTANNAPYGTAIANGAYTNYEAFRAFARRLNDVVDSATDSNHAAWAVNGSTGYIGYEFANPVEVTQIAYVPRYFNTECSKQSPATWQLEYSDDNSQWSIAQSYTEEITTQKEIRYRKLDTSFGYHRYWRMNITANLGSANFAGICALQFYGRELKVSVPTMTSNTAPYGEVISANTLSGYPAWKAFDGVTTVHGAVLLDSSGEWIGYTFTNPTRIKFITCRFGASDTQTAYSITIKAQYKHPNGEWTDIPNSTDSYTSVSGVHKPYYLNVDIDNVESMRFYVVNSGWHSEFVLVNFYGLDYSEKEFEEGTTKKWLYDHGVELEEMQFVGGTGTSISKNSSDVLLTDTSTSVMGCWFNNSAIDLTPYSLIRALIGNEWSNNTVGLIGCKSEKTTSASDIASYVLTANNAPYNEGLNISSVNQSLYVYLAPAGNSGTNRMRFTELWLE